jgi:hypothetical protein
MAGDFRLLRFLLDLGDCFNPIAMFVVANGIGGFAMTGIYGWGFLLAAVSSRSWGLLQSHSYVCGCKWNGGVLQ